MNRRHLRALLLAGISLGLFSGLAQARDHQQGRGERGRHFERHERHIRHEHRARWQHERWERERRAHYARHHRRPRGWDDGQKVGWDGRGVPPAGYKREAREHERWRERHTQHTPPGGHRPVLTAGGAQPPVGTHPAPTPTNRVWPTNTAQPQH